ARLLSCSGDKCITTTNASPLLAGICSKNCRNTATPPAEAPRPTTPVGFLFPPCLFFAVVALFLGESASAGICHFLYRRLSPPSSRKSPRYAITLSYDSGISASQCFSVFLVRLAPSRTLLLR